MKKNIHRGADLRDFLRQEAALEEVESRALKQALALRLTELLREKRVTKSAMASRMRTSRASLDRVLDTGNTSITLATLERAARALGHKVRIELVPS